jgi:hypothetical protein
VLLPRVPAPASRPLRLLALAAEGAIVCTLGDQLHVRFGVIEYTHPFLAGQAFWVPLVFFGAVTAMLIAYPILFGATRRALAWPQAHARIGQGTARAALVEFFCAYALTAIASAWPLAVLATLTGGFALRLWLDWRAADDPGRRALVAALPFVAAAIVVGPLFEALLVALGAFRYLHPHVLGLALWLPALYLWAAWAGRAMVHAWLGAAPRVG